MGDHAREQKLILSTVRSSLSRIHQLALQETRNLPFTCLNLAIYALVLFSKQGYMD